MEVQRWKYQMKYKYIFIILIISLLLVGCSDYSEQYIKKYNNAQESIGMSCSQHGMQSLGVFTENGEDFNVVCYTSSPFQTKIKELE